MVNTKFYKLADEALSRECARIESFTDALDKDSAAKKEQIAEYKCAKYRYATVSLIHSSIHNINRCRGLHDMSAFHHLLLPFDELFKQHGDYLALYDAAADAGVEVWAVDCTVTPATLTHRNDVPVQL